MQHIPTLSHTQVRVTVCDQVRDTEKKCATRCSVCTWCTSFPWQLEANLDLFVDTDSAVFSDKAEHLWRCSNEELASNHTLELEARGCDTELC